MKEFCTEAYYLIFSTLANRTRLAIIDVMKQGNKTISEISRALGQDGNVITNNLKPMLNCALVLSAGSGRYCINKEIIEPLSELLEFHVDKYCPGLTKCVAAEKLREYMKAEAARTTYIEHE